MLQTFLHMMRAAAETGRERRMGLACGPLGEQQAQIVQARSSYSTSGKQVRRRCRAITLSRHAKDGRLLLVKDLPLLRGHRLIDPQAEQYQIGLIRQLATQCLSLFFDGPTCRGPAGRVHHFGYDTAKIETLDEIIACGSWPRTDQGRPPPGVEQAALARLGP